MSGSSDLKLAYMKAGDAYMEQYNCLEVAIKNLAKNENHRVIALCGCNGKDIEVLDAKKVKHRYKFHFVLTDGMTVVDTMHYKRPVNVLKYFNKCISNNTVIDKRISEMDCEVLLKLVSNLGYERVDRLYNSL